MKSHPLLFWPLMLVLLPAVFLGLIENSSISLSSASRKTEEIEVKALEQTTSTPVSLLQGNALGGCDGLPFDRELKPDFSESTDPGLGDNEFPVKKRAGKPQAK